MAYIFWTGLQRITGVSILSTRKFYISPIPRRKKRWEKVDIPDVEYSLVRNSAERSSVNLLVQVSNVKQHGPRLISLFLSLLPGASCEKIQTPSRHVCYRLLHTQ